MSEDSRKADVIAAYDQACSRIENLLPGGHPMPSDMVGTRRAIARKFGVDQDDLKRWIDEREKAKGA
ncbi:MAG: hypothetical protein V4747_11330 [Pseudomonadota bacterium]